MHSAIYFTLFLFIFPLFYLLTRRNSKRLPPGSLGLPIVGQSLSMLHAMRTNTSEKWLQDRIRKYGPISKLSLFGIPTVFLHGQAANKFIYTCDGNTLANQQPHSIRKICGERNIMELSGDDHKRVRGALVSFLKPEVLKQYVGKMDEEIRMHLEMHWHGKQKVMVMPLMKTLTFNIICSLIFGIERGAKRDELVVLFQHLIGGVLSVPINLPFTQFNRSLKASAKIKTILLESIGEKRKALEQHGASPHQDLITCLLSIHNEDNSVALADEEIVDNALTIMVAGYDTSSILITFYEQEEIAKSKSAGELLTWDDLAKMKYTWRVATETLREGPKDIEYGGYLIPKGWQVVWAACMTHMDESIFPDPSKFDPTRFEKKAPAPPFSFVAFGGGPRMCPGNEFARIETLATMHYLVTQFKWKLCCVDNSFSRDPLPVFNHGLPIQIETKKSN
ncbi:hypothetical protein L1049_009931 [Liquidambar formosana]|uniref:Cytochrome P450 n=1 Tax=Liquidambar formosana TaxID=63359 RepID=A0AAP0N7J5_LIQFO